MNIKNIPYNLNLTQKKRNDNVAFTIDDILAIARKFKKNNSDEIYSNFRMIKEDKNLETDDEFAKELEEKLKITPLERKTLLVIFFLGYYYYLLISRCRNKIRYWNHC